MTFQAFILLLVFFGAGGIVVALYLYANRRRLTIATEARARLEAARARGVPVGVELSILKDERVSHLRFLERLLANKPITALLGDELTRAGSRMNVGEVLLASGVTAGLGALVGWRYGGVMVPLFAVVGGLLPVINLRRMQGARKRKFETQLPDAIDMLVSSMRAGYSLQAAMNFVGQEMPAPLGPAFARFHDEQRLGIDVRTALLDMQDRVGTLDIKMFVTSVLIQRETGGNLSEILGNIAAVMRDRVSFRGQLEALTAEPKMSARLLAALPVVVFFGLSAVNPDYIAPLTTSPTGRMLLAFSACSVVVGYFVMSKIADVEI